MTLLTREQSPYYLEFIEFITSQPTLAEMAQYQLSSAGEARISALLEANRQGELSAAEHAELDDYLRLEHLMRMMKYMAMSKLIKS